MSDPIQRTSSLPLPAYQTLAGTRDPLPVSSPKLLDKAQTAHVEARDDKLSSDFEAYLDQQSITVVEKHQDKTHFDTVDAIEAKGVYLQPSAGNVPL